MGGSGLSQIVILTLDFPLIKCFSRHCGISNDLLYLKLYSEKLIEFFGVHILDI